MMRREINSSQGPLFRGPRRSLGQNFLLDKNLARFAVDAVGMEEGDLVVEIGPGLGALTETILAGPAAEVWLLEKDRGLAARWREHRGRPGLRVIEGDALEFPLRELHTGRRVILLGNLPYNVATALISHFGGPVSPVRRMVVMVQKEVAERLAAKPHGGDFGALTVLVGRWWRVRVLRVLPPEVFRPRPKVDSALVLLERREAGEIIRCDQGRLEELVRAGFQQRRKQLRKLLGIPVADWERLAAELDFAPAARAENLSCAQWQLLAARWSGTVRDHSPPGSTEIFDVVDEEDQVVASLPRERVHADYLRHRAVHILLRNHAGEIFLQKRAPWKEINPNVWDSSAAGHLEAGETYEAAAHRELLEEVGVDTELRRLGKLTPCEATGNEFIEVYGGTHSGPFELAGLEITGGAFFPPEQIDRWSKQRPEDFSPVFRLCWPLWKAAHAAG